MPLKVCEWTCPGSNTNHDRDINAAINIQRQGITELMAAGPVVKAHRSLRKQPEKWEASPFTASSSHPTRLTSPTSRM